MIFTANTLIYPTRYIPASDFVHHFTILEKSYTQTHAFTCHFYEHKSTKYSVFKSKIALKRFEELVKI
jgi:hypothetical protein